MRPLVYIIVLNWNSCADTMHCIASLERLEYPNYRILVVENGSTDGSAAVLRTLGTRVRLIESRENLGYTGGNNLGIREAMANGADYLWMFNNDATAEPDTLTKLVDVCEADSIIGLVSPLVRDVEEGEQTIQLGCGRFDLDAGNFEPIFDLAQARVLHASFPDRITLAGTAMMVRRSLIQQIGSLDDRFFAYWEDIDYSIRSALAGYKNVLVFDAAVVHPSKPTIREPASVKPHFYYFMARNEILLWKKFVPFERRIRCSAWIMHRQLRQIERMENNQAGIDAILAGLWDGWRGIGGRYDPERRMPAPLRTIAARQPRLLINLIDGKLGGLRPIGSRLIERSPIPSRDHS